MCSESLHLSADCEFDQAQIMRLQRMSEIRAAVAEFGSIAERQLRAGSGHRASREACRIAADLLLHRRKSAWSPF
jgi:hypothetical protein